MSFSVVLQTGPALPINRSQHAEPGAATRPEIASTSVKAYYWLATGEQISVGEKVMSRNPQGPAEGFACASRKRGYNNVSS